MKSKYKKSALWVFTLLWSSRLNKDEKIIKITEWRSCLIQKPGSRQRIWFCFWKFQ